MTSRLTRAILAAVGAFTSWPLTAQGVTAEVRKVIPTADHPTVTAELVRLVDAGRLLALRKPRLPARYKLPHLHCTKRSEVRV